MKHFFIALILCITISFSQSAMEMEEETIFMTSNKGISQLANQIASYYYQKTAYAEIITTINGDPFVLQLRKNSDTTYTGSIIFYDREVLSKNRLSSVPETLQFIYDAFIQKGY